MLVHGFEVSGDTTSTQPPVLVCDSDRARFLRL